MTVQRTPTANHFLIMYVGLSADVVAYPRTEEEIVAVLDCGGRRPGERDPVRRWITLARYLMRDAADAEDAVQDTLCAATEFHFCPSFRTAAEPTRVPANKSGGLIGRLHGQSCCKG
jgi:hypothetical protein